MFPMIHHLNDLLPYIEGNKQFRVAPQPNGTTVVCYMLQDEDTFRGEHEDWYKECRGITFNTATGEVVSRTLHKFQNVGENDATQPDLIPWYSIVRVMDKRDGSMITPVLLPDGTIACKTKKTFTSNEALAANEFLHADPVKLDWVRKQLNRGYTPTFEWTSPKFPIVLLYEKDELTLLHLRHTILGEYDMWIVHPAFQKNCPFPIVENIIDEFASLACDEEAGFSGMQVCWETLKHAALTRTGIEGWIIQAGNGDMWKIKTKWYCELHHAVTFTRWRDVARVVLDDKSDDLKASFALTGRSIQPILDVEKKIFGEIERVKILCEEYAGLGKGFNRSVKDMAMMHKEHEHFRNIMRTFNGQDIDWNEWYLKKHIDTWSLEVIPTTSENEDSDELPSSPS